MVATPPWIEALLSFNPGVGTPIFRPPLSRHDTHTHTCAQPQRDMQYPSAPWREPVLHATADVLAEENKISFTLTKQCLSLDSIYRRACVWKSNRVHARLTSKQSGVCHISMDWPDRLLTVKPVLQFLWAYDNMMVRELGLPNDTDPCLKKVHLNPDSRSNWVRAAGRNGVVFVWGLLNSKKG